MSEFPPSTALYDFIFGYFSLYTFSLIKSFNDKFFCLISSFFTKNPSIISSFNNESESQIDNKSKEKSSKKQESSNKKNNTTNAKMKLFPAPKNITKNLCQTGFD